MEVRMQDRLVCPDCGQNKVNLEGKWHSCNPVDRIDHVIAAIHETVKPDVTLANIHWQATRALQMFWYEQSVKIKRNPEPALIDLLRAVKQELTQRGVTL